MPPPDHPAWMWLSIIAMSASVAGWFVALERGHHAWSAVFMLSTVIWTNTAAMLIAQFFL